MLVGCWSVCYPRHGVRPESDVGDEAHRREVEGNRGERRRSSGFSVRSDVSMAPVLNPSLDEGRMSRELKAQSMLSDPREICHLHPNHSIRVVWFTVVLRVCIPQYGSAKFSLWRCSILKLPAAAVAARKAHTSPHLLVFPSSSHRTFSSPHPRPASQLTVPPSIQSTPVDHSEMPKRQAGACHRMPLPAKNHASSPGRTVDLHLQASETSCKHPPTPNRAFHTRNNRNLTLIHQCELPKPSSSASGGTSLSLWILQSSHPWSVAGTLACIDSPTLLPTYVRQFITRRSRTGR